MVNKDKNVDNSVVSDFGVEWSRFQQNDNISDELYHIFRTQYFKIFPWDSLPESAVGADVGCGSGRWGKYVAERVGHLHFVDASEKALEVARTNLGERKNVDFHLATVDALPFDDNALDFIYSLGVLHHVPDTAAAIKSLVQKAKPGAPILLYLYYAFDNRPLWYRLIWRVSGVFLKLISRMPS